MSEIDHLKNEIERLKSKLSKCYEFAQWVVDAPVSSNTCCCGEYMASHSHADHSPTDMWDHALVGWVDYIQLPSDGDSVI